MAKERLVGIAAVAFDYGGVISLPQDKKAMDDLASIAGVDAALMHRIYWDNRPIYDQGLVSGEEYFRNILADAGVFPDAGTIQQLIERDLESWTPINSGTEALIRDIKAAGVPLGILSNMIQPFLDTMRKSIPLFSLFDAEVFSCEVDSVKPEEKIYRILLSRLGCAPEELVFFDDLEANVHGAQRLGITAFLWEDAQAARKELEQLGIKL